MFVIVAASRACKIAIFAERSEVRKSDHTFLPKGILIEPCLVNQLALLAESKLHVLYAVANLPATALHLEVLNGWQSRLKSTVDFTSLRMPGPS